MGWIYTIFSFIGWKVFFILILTFIICFYCWWKGPSNVYIPGFQPTNLQPPPLPLLPQVNPASNPPPSLPSLPLAPSLVTKPKKRCAKIREGWCREVLQEYYEKSFPSVKDPGVIPNPNPKYRNSKRHALEIDAYNAELAIGCEYNGEQHYMFPDPAGWNKTVEDFEKRLKYDRFKFAECERKAIYLIRVPYHQGKSKLTIFEFIIENLPSDRLAGDHNVRVQRMREKLQK